MQIRCVIEQNNLAEKNETESKIIKKEIGMPVKTIVATGTYAEHILPYCEKDIKYNKHLLLEGLKYIYDRNE